MGQCRTMAALVAGLLLGLSLFRPADTTAQDRCEQVISQFVHSYSDKTELSFTGIMEETRLEGDLYRFFVDYGCGDAIVQYMDPPGCEDGDRVTIVGIVIDIASIDEVEAHQVICVGG